MGEKPIEIRKLSEGELEAMDVFSWPVWEKEVSTFDWHYDEKESCYILKGRVRVEPEEGEAVEFGPGDFIVFPEGMDCIWKISEPVRKHYRFG
jgi:uncharacterized cupin superfamily protein